MYTSSRQKQKSQTAVNWQFEQQRFHLNKLSKICIKYHLRMFMGYFKSYVFQLLVSNIHKKPQINRNNNKQEYIYQFLMMKKNKNQHQLMELEFINMCAQTIQAYFKGYMVKKRHKKAMIKLKIFKQKATALLRGWKVRRILRCFRQKQIISIKSKRQQILKQQKSTQNAANKYSTKRLQYLKSSLKDELFNFHRKFKDLYNNGMWVFQSNIAMQKSQPTLSFPKWRKAQQNIKPLKQQTYFKKQQLQENDFRANKQEPKAVSLQQVKQEVVKPKRVREMRNNTQNRKISSNANLQQKSVTSQNPVSGSAVMQNKSSFNTRSSMNEMEDRPIMAKGSYSYNFSQNDQVSQQETEKSKPQKIQQQQSNKNEEGNQRQNDKKADIIKKQKKKLQKRQFYDPRKAIQEQKKRKKQQLQKISSNNEIKSNTQSQKLIQNTTKSSSNISIKQQPHQKVKINDVKSQKSFKIINQTQQIRNTVNIPKVKQKAEAKIDCWGNRKTVVKKTQGYGSKHSKINYNITSQTYQEKQPKNMENLEQIPVAMQLKKKISLTMAIQQKLQKPQQQSNLVIEPPQSPKRSEDSSKMLTHDALLKKIAEKRQKQKIKYQYSQQRIKKMLEIEKGREEVEQIKRNLEKNRNQNNISFNNNQYRRNQQEIVVTRPRMGSFGGGQIIGLKQRPRAPIDEQRRRQMAKQIQQLEEAYNVQYKNRLQILLPKLGLLGAAKQKQKGLGIVVIRPQQSMIKEAVGENQSQHLFWQKVTKMQKEFKQNLQFDHN